MGVAGTGGDVGGISEDESRAPKRRSPADNVAMRPATIMPHMAVMPDAVRSEPRAISNDPFLAAASAALQLAGLQSGQAPI